MRLLPGFLLLALLGPPAPAVSAGTQWVYGGIPVAATPDDEMTPLVVADGRGGSVIAWWRVGVDSGGIYAIGLDPDGVVGPGWLPRGRLVHGGSDPDMVGDGSGGAYIATRSFGAIAVQHFGPVGIASGSIAGTAAREDRAAPSRAIQSGEPFEVLHDGLVLPVVALDGQGGMFVSFTQDERFYENAFIRHYGPGGSQTTAQLRSRPGCSPYVCYGDRDATACPDGAGGVFVAWSIGCGLRVLRLNASLEVAPGWPDSGLSIEPCRAYNPFVGICADGAGGAYVAWHGYPSGPSDLRIQRVTGSGERAAGWPVEGLVLSPHMTLPGYSRPFGDFCSIAADGLGGALVTWTDKRADDGDVYVTRVVPGGTIAPGWPAEGVGVGVFAGLQHHPVVVADGSGGAVVAWEDVRGAPDLAIYTNHVGASGAIVPPATSEGVLVSGGPGVRVLPRLASDGSGGAVIVWVDYRAGNGDIYAARVLADGVVGTLIDLVSAEAEQGAVRLEWSVSAELTGPLWVERRTIESDFIRIATLLPGGSRRVTYLDRDVTPGGRYGYRLSAHDGDGGVQTDPVWVTVPGPPALVLERIRPNPAADVFTVGFELPGSGAARLEVVDAAGRVCVRREVGSLGPGRHEVMVGSRHALAAGIYLVRLTRGGEVRTERLSIIR